MSSNDFVFLVTDRVTKQRWEAVKIVVDRSRCTGLGFCEAMAPDIFEINEDMEMEVRTESIPMDLLTDVEAAISGCPTEALHLEQH